MKEINYLAIILLVGLCLFALPTQGFAIADDHDGGISSGQSSDRGSFGDRLCGGSCFNSRSHDGDSYGYYDPGTGPSSHEQAGFLALAALSVGGSSAFSIVGNERQKKKLKTEIPSRMSGAAKEKKTRFLEIQEISMEIQSAWEEETPEKARSCYTDKLFAEHQKAPQKNRADSVRDHIKKITIQEVGNYRQVREDSSATRIDFRCRNYPVDRKGGRVISGSKTQRQYFSQIWYFDLSEKEKRW